MVCQGFPNALCGACSPGNPKPAFMTTYRHGHGQGLLPGGVSDTYALFTFGTDLRPVCALATPL